MNACIVSHNCWQPLATASHLAPLTNRPAAMPLLEGPIPACMNSANLFLSPPLNAITNGDNDQRFSPLSPPRTRPSHHHDDRTTRLRVQPIATRTRELPPVIEQLLLGNGNNSGNGNGVASLAVAAASIGPPSSQRLPTLQSDPRNSHRPP